MERPEHFRVDVCNTMQLILDLTYLSIPPILFLERAERESKGRLRGNWSSQKRYQLLEVYWGSWN
jgi:hypothetical protein